MICSDFIRTLVMSDEDLFDFITNIKIRESFDKTKYRVIHYYRAF